MKKIIDNVLGVEEKEGGWSQEKKERKNGLRRRKNVGGRFSYGWLLNGNILKDFFVFLKAGQKLKEKKKADFSKLYLSEGCGILVNQTTSIYCLKSSRKGLICF